MSRLQLINMRKVVTVLRHRQPVMLRMVIHRVATDKHLRQQAIRQVLIMITVNIHRTIGKFNRIEWLIDSGNCSKIVMQIVECVNHNYLSECHTHAILITTISWVIAFHNSVLFLHRYAIRNLFLMWRRSNLLFLFRIHKICIYLNWIYQISCVCYTIRTSSLRHNFHSFTNYFPTVTVLLVINNPIRGIRKVIPKIITHNNMRALQIIVKLHPTIHNRLLNTIPDRTDMVSTVIDFLSFFLLRSIKTLKS